ncbi:hypothetical protein NE584_03335, partial [Clostridium sp. DFI.5.61]|uniref:hypothetical protein n=1 Tax=Clostridium sp. DFI.5.61 TaxID=2965279 RepID=UPI00210D159E
FSSSIFLHLPIDFLFADFHENGPGALYGASKKLCRCRRIIHEKEGEIRNENFLDRGGVPWI